MHESDIREQAERTSEPAGKPETSNSEARSEFGGQIRDGGTGHQPVSDLEQHQRPFVASQQRRPNERWHSAEAVEQLAINKRFRESIHQQASAGEQYSEDRPSILGAVVFAEWRKRSHSVSIK